MHPLLLLRQSQQRSPLELPDSIPVFLDLLLALGRPSASPLSQLCPSLPAALPIHLQRRHAPRARFVPLCGLAKGKLPKRHVRIRATCASSDESHPHREPVR